MIPVILSGGSGSRLWPLSRKQFPKQFLALTPACVLADTTDNLMNRSTLTGDWGGIVTSRDVRFENRLEATVRDVMTPKERLVGQGRRRQGRSPRTVAQAPHRARADRRRQICPQRHDDR